MKKWRIPVIDKQDAVPTWGEESPSPRAVIVEDATWGTVYIRPQVTAKIVALHRALRGKEFGLLLYGAFDEERRRVDIHAAYVPRQTVTSASVDFDDTDRPQRFGEWELLGCYHSHGDMQAFFSGTDEAYLLRAFRVNIVGNDGLDMKAVISDVVEVYGERFVAAVPASVVLDGGITAEELDKIRDAHLYLKTKDEKLSTPTLEDIYCAAYDVADDDGDYDVVGYLTEWLERFEDMSQPAPRFPAVNEFLTVTGGDWRLAARVSDLYLKVLREVRHEDDRRRAER